VIRFLGGVIFLAGAVVMAWNLYRSVAGARAYDAAIPVPAAAH
jgi:cytochrome c oxidase cbb3-type subunit I